MQDTFYQLSRGDLFRALGADMAQYSVKKPIADLMAKVQGAELVAEINGRIGDGYSAVYFVSPEAVAVRFNAEISVRVEAFGTTSETLRAAYKRIDAVLRKR